MNESREGDAPQFPGLPVDPEESQQFKPAPPRRRRHSTDDPNVAAVVFSFLVVGGILTFCVWSMVAYEPSDKISPTQVTHDDVRSFLDTMPDYGGLVSEAKYDGTHLRIIVSNTWFLLPKGIRLQRAQEMQEVWAATVSPNRPDDARIKVVDVRGNELAGSRIAGGTLIWIDE